MLKKTITFTDFNGVQRTEDFYFNLTNAELTELEMSKSGGMTAYIERISKTKSAPELIKMFKEIILLAYGVKSDDGRRFIKNQEVRDEFAQTEAYSMLFMELATDYDAVAKFIQGVLPSDKAQAAKEKQIEMQNANHPALNQ